MRKATLSSQRRRGVGHLSKEIMVQREQYSQACCGCCHPPSCSGWSQLQFHRS